MPICRASTWRTSMSSSYYRPGNRALHSCPARIRPSSTTSCANITSGRSARTTASSTSAGRSRFPRIGTTATTLRPGSWSIRTGHCRSITDSRNWHAMTPTATPLGGVMINSGQSICHETGQFYLLLTLIQGVRSH